MIHAHVVQERSIRTAAEEHHKIRDRFKVPRAYMTGDMFSERSC